MPTDNDACANKGDNCFAPADAEAPPDMENGGEARSDEPGELEMLQSRVAELEQEKEELQNRVLRLQADFDNFRKRTRAEKTELIDYAAVDLVCKLLPVLDNLDRACASTEAGSEGLAEGITMITRQLKEVLGKEGLKAVECRGKPFDPQYHDAVLREENKDYPPNTVVDELQSGYMFKDRVLRPSMVKVAVE